jgi:hypothetical protein
MIWSAGATASASVSVASERPPEPGCSGAKCRDALVVGQNDRAVAGIDGELHVEIGEDRKELPGHGATMSDLDGS